MSFTVETIDQQKRKAEQTEMSVILKQRTARTADGRACADGDREAAFIVGPKGGKISDITARSLGLVNGWLPGEKERQAQDKEKKTVEDKTGRTEPATGRPMTLPAPKKENAEARAEANADPDGAEPTAADMRAGRIKAAMIEMDTEAEVGGDKVRKKLFTADGRPDSRVLCTRLGDRISSEERDEVWVKIAEEKAFGEGGAPANDDPI